MTTIRQSLRDALIIAVDDNDPLPRTDISTALAALVADMEANSQSVDASAVSANVVADAGNNGDAVVVVSTKRADGRVQELLLAEDIRLLVVSDSSPANASISARGGSTGHESTCC